MIFQDRVYGFEEINKPVLEELIFSKEVERLKNISQLGMPEKYYLKKGFSRYEHSMGVLILLRRLGANLEEQIAGLLHDLSHKAFSHVVDWIVGDPLKEDHQDKSHFNFIKNSNIPKTLEKYGFDYVKISNTKNFPLLESDAPSLCADRIDYTLREMSLDGEGKVAKEIFRNLICVENQIVFENQKYGELFYKYYSNLNRTVWSSNDSKMRYVILSDILKRAFDIGLLSFKDLDKPENKILNILECSKEKFILDGLDNLKNGFDLIEVEDGIELKTKFRYIDPEIHFRKSYKKLSEVSEKYLDLIEIEKENWKPLRKVRLERRGL